MNAKSKHNRFFFLKQKQAFAFQFHPMQDNFTGRGRGREGRVVVGREVAAEGGWFTEDGWRRGCGGGVGGCRMEEKSSSLILFYFKTTPVEPYHWFSFSHFSPLFSSFLFLPPPPPPPPPPPLSHLWCHQVFKTKQRYNEWLWAHHQQACWLYVVS